MDFSEKTSEVLSIITKETKLFDQSEVEFKDLNIPKIDEIKTENFQNSCPQFKWRENVKTENLDTSENNQVVILQYDIKNEFLQKNKKIIFLRSTGVCKKCCLPVKSHRKHRCRKFYRTCFFCGQFFSHTSLFLSHFFVYHFSFKNNCFTNTNIQKVKEYQNKICLKLFGRNRHLKTFIHSNKNSFKLFKTNKTINKVLSENISRKHNNHTCEEPFNCEICCAKKPILNNNIDQQPILKSYHCEICLKSFTKLYNFKIHMYVHSDEKLFKCEICPKSFKRKERLKGHIKLHTGENLFKCDICLKSFTEKCTLKYHIKVHTGEKPFNCLICSNSFTTNGGLKKHMRIHTGEKLFHCEICLKKFTAKTNFNNHMRIHSGEKIFNCEICLKSFTRKTTLENHIKIHTGEKPYKCVICSKSFRQQSSLNSHMKIHTGEKPFKCETCFKRFANKGHLTRHMKTHTRIKKNHCDICFKYFTHRGNLNKHIKTHTKKLS